MAAQIQQLQVYFIPFQPPKFFSQISRRTMLPLPILKGIWHKKRQRLYQSWADKLGWLNHCLKLSTRIWKIPSFPLPPHIPTPCFKGEVLHNFRNQFCPQVQTSKVQVKYTTAGSRFLGPCFLLPKADPKVSFRRWIQAESNHAGGFYARDSNT